MHGNSLFNKPEKAVIIATYYSPDIIFEQVLKNSVKCASIVEKPGEKLPLRCVIVQVNFHVDPIFGKLLWRQINGTSCFCIHLTTWLFHQWKKIEERNGEASMTIYFQYHLDLISIAQ